MRACAWRLSQGDEADEVDEADLVAEGAHCGEAREEGRASLAWRVVPVVLSYDVKKVSLVNLVKSSSTTTQRNK